MTPYKLVAKENEQGRETKAPVLVRFKMYLKFLLECVH